MGFVRLYIKTTSALTANTIYDVVTLSSHTAETIQALSVHCSKKAEAWISSTGIRFRPYEAMSTTGYAIYITGWWTN